MVPWACARRGMAPTPARTQGPRRLPSSSGRTRRTSRKPCLTRRRTDDSRHGATTRRNDTASTSCHDPGWSPKVSCAQAAVDGPRMIGRGTLVAGEVPSNPKSPPRGRRRLYLEAQTNPEAEVSEGRSVVDLPNNAMRPATWVMPPGRREAWHRMRRDQDAKADHGRPVLASPWHMAGPAVVVGVMWRRRTNKRGGRRDIVPIAIGLSVANRRYVAPGQGHANSLAAP